MCMQLWWRVEPALRAVSDWPLEASRGKLGLSLIRLASTVSAQQSCTSAYDTVKEGIGANLIYY